MIRPPTSYSIRHLTLAAFGTLSALGVPAVACSSDDQSSADPSASSPPAEEAGAAVTEPIVLSGQGNNLDAYSISGDDVNAQRVITNVGDDPDGLDINAQLCVFESDGKRMLIAGEDTGQPDPPAGWGIFEVTGDTVGELSATRIAKLTPTFQTGDADQPENYGCGVLGDGRILTTDVGEQVTGSNGQLILWFPPFEGTAEGDIGYCKLDIALPTAQSILVTGPETFLVAAARGGVFEYSGPLPTDPTPAGGCDGTDTTARGLATTVTRRTLVEPGANGMVSPAGLAPAPDEGFYASSVFTGVINEYDAGGTFRRTIMAPPQGETLGSQPYDTGTPLGLATDSEGNLWYADIGLVLDDSGVGPGDQTGTVRVIRFADGEPSTPFVVADGLAFPDGLGALPVGSGETG